ncbi:hypothetical protein C5S53_08960 [Methanophagales archaeon]|nr:hypothetical protein C5S53_08960 [Methanophagales archaeon]
MAMAGKEGIQKEEIEKIIIEELPKLMADSPAFRHQLIGIMAETFVRKEELKQVLDAIHDLREDFNTRFEEHSRIQEEHSKRLEELSKRLEELSERQGTHTKTIEELMKRLDENEKRLESAIGGLGARGGIMSEESFRKGLKGILQGIGLSVERYIDYDQEGYVFGHPDQVELDVLIKNKSTLLVEIKSSISKEEVYTFQRKVEFYEKKQKVKEVKKGVISPSVDPRVKSVAERQGIEFYTSGYDVRI